MNTGIRILQNSKIDTTRWNNTIQNANNTREYALSWYLDILSPDWKGIVYGNYDYVMPLVTKKKWGINYAFQPTYAQQHGIYPTPTPEITNKFLELLFTEIPYFNISFNSQNIIKAANCVQIERKNYILSLKNTYSQILSGYDKHASRYAKKAASQVTIMKDVTLPAFLQLKYQTKQPFEKKQDIENLTKIVATSTRSGNGLISGAYNQYNELIAAAFFLTEKNRYTYLNACSSKEGLEKRAMFAIVDRFIADHAGTGKFLDFEGSMHTGVARFYEGFGAKPETYTHLQYNNLPWFVKLFKK